MDAKAMLKAAANRRLRVTEDGKIVIYVEEVDDEIAIVNKPTSDGKDRFALADHEGRPLETPSLGWQLRHKSYDGAREARAGAETTRILIKLDRALARGQGIAERAAGAAEKAENRARKLEEAVKKLEARIARLEGAPAEVEEAA